MSSKTLLFVLADLVIFIFLLRLVFRSFKEIKNCFFYLIKPDIISIIDKSYTKDFN